MLLLMLIYDLFWWGKLPYPSHTLPLLREEKNMTIITKQLYVHASKTSFFLLINFSEKDRLRVVDPCARKLKTIFYLSYC